MNESATKIPNGYHSINCYLVVRNAAKAIDFYKKAFGAEERFRMHGPDGKIIMHAELKIGDSVFMLTEESTEMKTLSPESIGGSPVSYDVDAVFNQAVSEDATVLNPVRDQFYGDRFGY
jgi:PhnB protein